MIVRVIELSITTGDDATGATIARSGSGYRVLAIIAARSAWQAVFPIAEYGAILGVRKRSSQLDCPQHDTGLRRQFGDGNARACLLRGGRARFNYVGSNTSKREPQAESNAVNQETAGPRSLPGAVRVSPEPSSCLRFRHYDRVIFNFFCSLLARVLRLPWVGTGQ